jgi:hypothetical protein
VAEPAGGDRLPEPPVHRGRVIQHLDALRDHIRSQVGAAVPDAVQALLQAMTVKIDVTSRRSITLTFRIPAIPETPLAAAAGTDAQVRTLPGSVPRWDSNLCPRLGIVRTQTCRWRACPLRWARCTPRSDATGTGRSSCAHEVADAIGADPYSSVAPDGGYRWIPLVADGEHPPVRLAALVRQWSPIAADGSGDRAAGTHGSRFVRGPGAAAVAHRQALGRGGRRQPRTWPARPPHRPPANGGPAAGR